MQQLAGRAVCLIDKPPLNEAAQALAKDLHKFSLRPIKSCSTNSWSRRTNLRIFISSSRSLGIKNLKAGLGTSSSRRLASS